MARIAQESVLWTPEELELFLREPAPPSTPDPSLLKPGTSASMSTTSNSKSNSPSLDVRPGTAMDVSDPPAEIELDATARRTRRTEIERLSRRRRQASLRAMRDEVRGLETKFAGLLEGHATRKRISSGSYLNRALEEDVADDDDDDSSSVLKYGDQMRRLRERFIELKLRENELHDQKQQLQRSLRDKEMAAMSIQSVVFSAARTWTDPESPPPGGELEFKLHPAEEFVQLMRGAYEELQALEATTAFESLGSQCLGWSHRRSVEETRVIFSLTKTFEGRDAEPILLASWDVFSSEARLRQSFGSWGIHVQLRVLDRPSDDIFVIHRSNIRRGCRSKGERRAHVVMLLFRVRTPDGVTLCMRSMPSLQTELEPPDHWTGIFTWIHFRESTRSDGTKSCEVTYSNYMPSPPRWRSLSNLFVAFLSTVVRWESACVASHLLA